MPRLKFYWILIFLSVFACTKPQTSQMLSEQSAAGSSFSLYKPGNRWAPVTGDRFIDEVQPVIAQRCAVCHSCSNGPCQLNMTSFAALSRGLSQFNPYNFRLVDTFSTRVSDNRPIDYWRAKGFTTVLPSPGEDPSDSLIYQALEAGRANIPEELNGQLTHELAQKLAQTHNNRSYICPLNKTDYRAFLQKTPQGGMPFGLPSPTDAEYHILADWILSGAPGPSERAHSLVAAPQQSSQSRQEPQSIVDEWELFLNAESLQQQLVSRYIYEHAYQANVELIENRGEFYRLVRSRQAAPLPIDRIVTDAPTDDPGVSRVYYRFEKIDRVIEGKTHVLWQLGLQDIEQLDAIFFAEEWQLSKLPGFASVNPFKNFQAIPAKARSQFMLNNARMIYQSFARGPICASQTASYVADDHYWTWFLKPESDPSVLKPNLGLDNYDSFFTKDGKLFDGLPIIGGKLGEPIYRQAYEKTLRQLKPDGLSVNDIWTGDGENPNAWLVYHRHQVSAEFTSAKERPILGKSRSVVLISYANFERMYYNATVTYKYWGSLKHQNDSFMFETLQRTEGEDLYISLYRNKSLRQSIRNRYNSNEAKVYYRLFKDYASGRSAKEDFQDEDSLMRTVYHNMGPGVIQREDKLNNWPLTLPKFLPDSVKDSADFEAGLRFVASLKLQKFAKFWPNVVHIRVAGQDLYTILAERSSRPDKIAALEKQSRDPEHDRLLMVNGFAGFESHLFIDLSLDKAPAFLKSLIAIESLEEWQEFRQTYAIRRASPAFWPFVDWMHQWMSREMPSEAGLLELRFYDKDTQPF
jgi:hypothetical protein